jgi:hypothetical protein
MGTMKDYQLEVYLNNGVRLQTRFSQNLEEGQRPAARFYLGYSSDAAMTQDLPWIAVGEIAYMPDEAVAVRIIPANEADQQLGQLRAV